MKGGISFFPSKYLPYVCIYATFCFDNKVTFHDSNKAEQVSFNYFFFSFFPGSCEILIEQGNMYFQSVLVHLVTILLPLSIIEQCNLHMYKHVSMNKFEQIYVNYNYIHYKYMCIQVNLLNPTKDIRFLKYLASCIRTNVKKPSAGAIIRPE